MSTVTKSKEPWGFALLSKEERQKLGRKGGQNAHKLGRAHTYTSEEAREAGRIGGLRASANRRRARREEARAA